MPFQKGTEVGASTRFQKGRTGNAGGRPRGVLNCTTRLWEDLARIVDEHWQTPDAQEYLRMWLRMKTAKGHLPDVLKVTTQICPQPLATISDGRSRLADVPLHVLIEAAKPLLEASDPLDNATVVSADKSPCSADGAAK